jgi:hypothetical protein
MECERCLGNRELPDVTTGGAESVPCPECSSREWREPEDFEQSNEEE